MSVFEQFYENPENAIATVAQAVTKRELLSLYQSNRRIFDTNDVARKKLLAALAKIDMDTQREQFRHV